MKNKYYDEIKKMILNYEVNKKMRKNEEEKEKLILNWEIGRILNKVNEETISKWAQDYTLEYGKDYNKLNLDKFLKFYLDFPSLSKKIVSEIINKDEKKLNVKDKLKEKVKHQETLNQIVKYFLELEKGFTLLGQNYQIKLGNKTYNIDLLFYNYEIKALVVILLKSSKFKPSTKRELEFYLNLVDAKLKKEEFKRTEGILIGEENNEYIIKYISHKSLTNFLMTSKNV